MVITALSLLSLSASVASADSENPFQGSWIGGDPAPPDGDGSINTLRVGGGKNHVLYQEDLLSACDQFTGSPLRGYATGFATIENGTLTVNTTIICIVPGLGAVPTEKFPQPFDLVFTDNGDGTLTSDGGCYHRPGRAEDCQGDVFTCEDVLGCVTYDETDPIRVATSFATSGDVGFLGLDSLHGVEIAIDRFGPVRGHDVDLSNFDSLCSFGGGEAAANAIAADSTFAGVLGTSCSGAAAGAAPILSAAGFTMISPSNTAPFLTDPATHSPGYFRTVESDAGQGTTLAEHLWADGAVTSAVIVDGDPYTIAVGEAFRDEFVSLGGTNLATATVSPDGSNAAATVAAATSSGIPDAIVIVAFEPAGSALVNEIRSIPALDATQLAATDSLLSGDFFFNAGPNAQGMLFTTFDTSYESSPEYVDFITDYIGAFGFPTAPFHAMASDATDLLLGGIETVGIIDGDGTLHVGRQALRDAVESTIGLDGLTGTISCTPLGDCGGHGHIAFVPFP